MAFLLKHNRIIISTENCNKKKLGEMKRLKKDCHRGRYWNQKTLIRCEGDARWQESCKLTSSSSSSSSSSLQQGRPNLITTRAAAQLSSAQFKTTQRLEKRKWKGKSLVFRFRSLHHLVSRLFTSGIIIIDVRQVLIFRSFLLSFFFSFFSPYHNSSDIKLKKTLYKMSFLRHLHAVSFYFAYAI